MSSKIEEVFADTEDLLTESAMDDRRPGTVGAGSLVRNPQRSSGFRHTCRLPQLYRRRAFSGYEPESKRIPGRSNLF